MFPPSSLHPSGPDPARTPAACCRESWAGRPPAAPPCLRPRRVPGLVTTLLPGVRWDLAGPLTRVSLTIREVGIFSRACGKPASSWRDFYSGFCF